jgi:hypothetical protein
VTGVQNLKKKTILAFALMLLLTLAGTFLLVRSGIRLVEEREENRTVRKTSTYFFPPCIISIWDIAPP